MTSSLALIRWWRSLANTRGSRSPARIASTIASQFTEATGDLYLQSLIALGLVLFLLTFVLNGLARLLIVVTTQKGSEVTK